MFCKKCGIKNSESANFCIGCGTKLEHVISEEGTREKPHQTVDMVYPATKPYSPLLIAFLNFLLCGLGNFVCGQKRKGFFWLGLEIIMAFLFYKTIIFFIFVIMVILDGYLIAKKLQNGEPVDEWEFFPGY